VGPNDGSEAELVSAFVNSDGAPQPDASPRSQRSDKETGSGSGGDGASQEAVDLYLSSWKKKFNFAGTCSTLHTRDCSRRATITTAFIIIIG
jgi:uncharacterized membrane protein